MSKRGKEFYPGWKMTVEQHGRYWRDVSAVALRLKVNAAPDLNAADREQLVAAREFSKIESPALMRFAGEKARLPRTLINDLVKELAERQAALAPPKTPGMLGNGPLAGTEVPPRAPGGFPGRPEPVGVAG